MSGDSSRSDAAGDRDLRSELGAFGLSEKEIETYLAVLERGEAKASVISEDAGVSKRYVYSIAERLERRGLVRVNEHAAPTTVRARPPREAIAALSQRLEAITPALEERFAETEPQTSQFETVRSRQTALKRLRTMLSEAESEAFLSIPERTYSEIQAELSEAVERGALVLLLVGGADADADERRFDGAASVVRRWTEDAPFMLTVDNRSAIVGDAGLLSGTHADETAVALSQEHIAGSVLGSFISSFWPVATETYVTEPCPLPATFDAFRHAVLQACLHKRAGNDLRVRVETEDGPEIVGRVSRVRQAITEPVTSGFPVENSIVVETDGALGDAEPAGNAGEVSDDEPAMAADEVTVGGRGAFIEDYRAESVTLLPE
ncbi:TrmB family transcriptional regulator [Halegenticoccus soli]|uniref:TrmB family transcriptional regulator n=1 Tax=Halegenticoccus soli TaxID=1985678 RepID=UPI000C6EF797|nr:TrmB family transcriptional regulator sugar-binding domain-containing protein [Halegenticoccus soli]